MLECCLQRLEEDVESPRPWLQTVVNGHVGTGNRTWVLQKGSQHFSLLSHLCRHPPLFSLNILLVCKEVTGPLISTPSPGMHISTHTQPFRSATRKVTNIYRWQAPQLLLCKCDHMDPQPGTGEWEECGKLRNYRQEKSRQAIVRAYGSLYRKWGRSEE